jgi:hypothetical protein
VYPDIFESCATIPSDEQQQASINWSQRGEMERAAYSRQKDYKQMRRDERDTGTNKMPYWQAHQNDSDLTLPCAQHRHPLFSSTVLMMTAEELEALYEELSYPSATKFRRAVQKRGGSI